MIYCENAREYKRFRYLAYPVPRPVLNALFESGLSIWVVPNGQKGRDILYGKLQIKQEVHGHIGRYPHQYHFYHAQKNIVVLHSVDLQRPGRNIVIHEIAHAFDRYLKLRYQWQEKHLYFSDADPMKALLEHTEYLTETSERVDKKAKNRREHFALCMEAYLSESEGPISVRNLNPRTIRAFCRLFNAFSR